jgi:hypothetical protein
MINIAYYLATKEIAERCNLIGHRYIAKDGRFILDNKDLSRLRLTPEEYIEGLKGVEKISQKKAQDLIAKNNYNLGRDYELDNKEV